MSVSKGQLLEIAEGIASVNTKDELYDLACQAAFETSSNERTRGLLSERVGKMATARLFESTSDMPLGQMTLRNQIDAGMLSLWVGGFDDVAVQTDLDRWRHLADSTPFQQRLKEAYDRWYSVKDMNSMIGGRTIMATVMGLNKEDQATLNTEAMWWGALCRTAWTQVDQVYARRQTDLLPSNRAALGVSSYLAKRYRGDAVRSELLGYAESFTYREGNEERYFYYKLRESYDTDAHRRLLHNPDKILHVATAIDIRQGEVDSEFIAGLRDRLVCVIDDLPDTTKPDNDRTMKYLGGASQILMQIVEYAADVQGNKQNDFRKIRAFLEAESRSGFRILQPRLRDIVRLANGFTETINQTIPRDHEQLRHITDGTIDGYYDAFDRVLFVVNELAAQNNTQEVPRLIGDLSDIATSLIKIGTPYLKNHGSLRNTEEVHEK